MRELGHTIIEFFLLPGNAALAAMIDAFPALGAVPWLEGGEQSLVAASLVSALAWLLLFYLLGRVLAGVTIAGRWLRGGLDAVAFRLGLLRHRFFRSLAAIVSMLSRRRRTTGIESGIVNLGRRDIEVLRTVLSQPPGIAVSAPDLAEPLGLRPAEIHGSLVRLSGYCLLETVIGSTDGFDNFRATPTGAAFAGSLERR